jgi:hypothetical protein
MLGPSAPTDGPFLLTQTDWLEFALKRFSNRAGAGAGRRVSIAYVVGATHFPWVGAAIETQLATIPALTDCPPRNRPKWPGRTGGGEKCAQRARCPRQCSRPKRPRRDRPVRSRSRCDPRCQVQSGAEPSRKCATARIACSGRMASQGCSERMVSQGSGADILE